MKASDHGDNLGPRTKARRKRAAMKALAVSGQRLVRLHELKAPDFVIDTECRILLVKIADWMKYR